MDAYINRFVDFVISSIPNVLAAVIIFVVTLYSSRLVSNLLQRGLRSRRVATGIVTLLMQTTRWTILIVGMTMAVQRFFDVTAFLTGLGIIGFTVGFALQDTMKNLTAGIILLVQQPFHIGEVVGAAGFDGTILNIDLRTTEMETTDGRIVTLPNSNILSNPIINYTRARRLRVDINLPLSHDADPSMLRGLMLETVQTVAGFVKDPSASVVFNNLTSSALEMACSFWIDASKNNPGDAKGDVLLKMKSAFQQKGIVLSPAAQALLLRSE